MAFIIAWVYFVRPAFQYGRCYILEALFLVGESSRKRVNDKNDKLLVSEVSTAGQYD